jgi:hypothetical protein
VAAVAVARPHLTVLRRAVSAWEMTRSIEASAQLRTTCSGIDLLLNVRAHAPYLN